MSAMQDKIAALAKQHGRGFYRNRHAPDDYAVTFTKAELEQFSAALAAQPSPAAAKPVNGIKATMFHDEGAIAQCSYCGRYTLDHKALSDRPPVCACGKAHGWCGSFKKPTHEAQWSGAAPAAVEGRKPLTRMQVQDIVINVCDKLYPQDDASFSEADSVFYGAFVHAIEAAHGITAAPAPAATTEQGD